MSKGNGAPNLAQYICHDALPTPRRARCRGRRARPDRRHARRVPPVTRPSRSTSTRRVPAPKRRLGVLGLDHERPDARTRRADRARPTRRPVVRAVRGRRRLLVRRRAARGRAAVPARPRHERQRLDLRGHDRAAARRPIRSCPPERGSAWPRRGRQSEPEHSGDRRSRRARRFRPLPFVRVSRRRRRSRLASMAHHAAGRAGPAFGQGSGPRRDRRPGGCDPRERRRPSRVRVGPGLCRARARRVEPAGAPGSRRDRATAVRPAQLQPERRRRPSFGRLRHPRSRARPGGQSRRARSGRRRLCRVVASREGEPGDAGRAGKRPLARAGLHRRRPIRHVRRDRDPFDRRQRQTGMAPWQRARAAEPDRVAGSSGDRGRRASRADQSLQRGLDLRRGHARRRRRIGRREPPSRLETCDRPRPSAKASTKRRSS